ncbi:hypothetical protein AMS68_003076 [Peltaster fructicola]|uniref:Selenoprotein W-like protein n=1 Tax=Peltaster fructicola TaxID=286661 RepID=A0A6H0XSG2_9PEZI|nr:hypothetical protein AMS68_003076 [Peltaster fructicola]
MSSSTTNQVKLPRVAITFCTQCRWMLRAAYFGQELLSTFGATIGEVALIPASGGLFQVNLSYDKAVIGDDQDETQLTHVLIWDRKTEGGFPETKVLKQLIRNHIDPQKDLGHSDAAAKSMEPGREAKHQKQRNSAVLTALDLNQVKSPKATPQRRISKSSSVVTRMQTLIDDASRKNLDINNDQTRPTMFETSNGGCDATISTLSNSMGEMQDVVRLGWK